jgi:hypothetical protein
VYISLIRHYLTTILERNKRNIGHAITTDIRVLSTIVAMRRNGEMNDRVSKRKNIVWCKPSIAVAYIIN